MLNGRRILAIVPARAGSKRLPDKNIQQVGGISLVGWAVLAGKSTHLIDHVVVSTDGVAIAQEAFRYGADSVLKRPLDLSGDNISMQQVVLHALRNYKADIFVLLQPSSPARPRQIIEDCIYRFCDVEEYMLCTVSVKTHKQDGLVYVAGQYYNDDFTAPYRAVHPLSETSIDIDNWADLVEAQALYEKNPDLFPPRG